MDTSPPRTFVHRLGKEAIDTVRTGFQLLELLLHTLSLTLRLRWPRGHVLEQMYRVGNKSLFFVIITVGMIGMVLVFQSGLQLQRVTGDLSQLGAEFIKVLLHEFGPTITALMLATRVGAGIAAEIGSMVVTEQVDALRMSQVDPVEQLIVPRVVATTVMGAALAIVGIVSAVGLGALTASTTFGINLNIFFDLGRVTFADLGIGLCKCVAYGMAIPIVSGHAGLTAGRGAEGVGTATTRAVINSSLAVIVLDFVISGIGFVFFRGGEL
jgi:phospholipid/cholesterol/gamma-HCH transport system permease protein